MDSLLIRVGPFKGATTQDYLNLLRNNDCYAWEEKLPSSFFDSTTRTHIVGEFYRTKFSCFVEKAFEPELKGLETLCVNPGPIPLPLLKAKLTEASVKMPQYVNVELSTYSGINQRVA